MSDRDVLHAPHLPATDPAQPTFEEVYEAHFGFVWRCVVSRGVPRSACDDVVQEVFLVVHRKLASFEGRSSLRTWLWTIVRRVVRDHLRKRGNASEGEPLAEDQASSWLGPAEALEQKAAVEILDALLARMPESQREVFVMYEVEEMTGGEIAEALGVNENTVRTRLRAARQIFNSGTSRQRAGQLWGGHGRPDES